MRTPQLDQPCGWCRFEGRETETFAYGTGTHWCPWHQTEVPPAKDGKEVVPAGARDYEVTWNELKQWRGR